MGSYGWLVGTGDGAAPDGTARHADDQHAHADALRRRSLRHHRVSSPFTARLRVADRLDRDPRLPRGVPGDDAARPRGGARRRVDHRDGDRRPRARHLRRRARGADASSPNASPPTSSSSAARRGVSRAGSWPSPEEAFESEHFIARGFQVEVEHEDLGRSYRYPGAPFLMPASPWAISRRGTEGR